MDAVPRDCFLRFDSVAEMVGLSRTTIWRMERRGEFPKRVQLGRNSVAWRLSQISAWMGGR